MRQNFSLFSFFVAIAISALTAQACPEKGCVDPTPWPVRNPPCHSKCLVSDIETNAALTAVASTGANVNSVQSNLQQNSLAENTDEYVGTVHVDLDSAVSVDCEVHMLAQHTETHTYKSYDQVRCH